MQCAEENCVEPAVVHFLKAAHYRVVLEKQLCELHGRAFIFQYHASAYTTAGQLSLSHDIAQYDIELLAIYNGSHQQGVYLKMVEGQHRFFMLIGAVEAWALSYYLRGSQSPRPLTHAVLSQAIASLGGDLRDVLIADVDEATESYRARLRIGQGNRLLLVDARPSDALSLAVVSSVPILLSPQVARHGGGHRGQGGQVSGAGV